ncbi:MAG: hypothetical protein U9N54_04655 [candidate division Zixibacteria bacterium]|nr:hypothetical protein [candidate division Zixibacteria bacterium]
MNIPALITEITTYSSLINSSITTSLLNIISDITRQSLSIRQRHSSRPMVGKACQSLFHCEQRNQHARVNIFWQVFQRTDAN